LFQKQNLKLAWPAHRQAKFLAGHLLGKNEEPLKYIGTFLIKSFELNIGMTGLNEKSLQKLGYNYDVTLISHSDKVGIIPSSEMIYMKLLFEKETGKIYGAQAVGKGVVDKRIDVIGTLIKMGGTLSDLYDLELGYQPYYSTTEDINNIIANHAINICKGRLAHVKFSDFCYIKDDYEIIDIRNKSAFEKCHIKGARLFEASKLRKEYEKLPKDKKILFYDETGITSSNMIKMLNNFAYNNIYMLDGGLLYFRKYDDYFKLNMLC